MLAMLAFALVSCSEEPVAPVKPSEGVAFSSNAGTKIEAFGRVKDPSYNRYYKSAFIVKIKENSYSVGGVLENGKTVWPGGKQTVVNTVSSLEYDEVLKKYVLTGTKNGKDVTLVGAPNGHRNWLPMATGRVKDPRYGRYYQAAFVVKVSKSGYAVAGIQEGNNKIIWPGGKQVVVNKVTCLEFNEQLKQYVLTGEKDGKKVTLIGAPNGHRNWKPYFTYGKAKDPRYGRYYQAAFIVKLKENSYSVGGIQEGNNKIIWPGGKQTLVNSVESLTYDYKQKQYKLKGIKDGQKVTLVGAPNGHKNWSQVGD